MNADVFEAVCAMGDAARTAQSQLAQANTEAKNQLLNAIADALDQHADDIAAANTLDMNQAETDGMDAGKLDRLKFDQQRIAAAAQGVRHVASLPDPIGEIVRGYHLENGLRLQQVRVPIGVLGMIYEARPTSPSTLPPYASNPATPSCCAADTRPNTPTRQHSPSSPTYSPNTDTTTT